VLFFAPPLAAQVAATVDVGVSWVRYDGYLASGAAHVAPAIRYRRPSLSLTARGSYLRFESGNTVLQSSFAGSWLSPALGHLRLELTASGGVSNYADFPTYGHAIVGGRLHRAGTRMGAWIGGLGGQSYFGGATSNAAQVEVGGWIARGPLLVSGVVTRTWFVDTAYLDAVGQARWRTRHLDVRAIAGVRAWSDGGGSGTYAELTATVPLGDRLGIFVGGGRYPSDLVRGVLAGRYLTGGIRITGITFRDRAERGVDESLADLVRERTRRSSTPGMLAARLEIIPERGSEYTLRIDAPGAEHVELMGDFTEWRPVALRRAEGARWEVTLPIQPGVHRLNVRLDDGLWRVPDGVRVEQDDYGGTVGIVLVR
jgi:hypothetical protein